MYYKRFVFTQDLLYQSAGVENNMSEMPEARILVVDDEKNIANL